MLNIYIYIKKKKKKKKNRLFNILKYKNKKRNLFKKNRSTKIFFFHIFQLLILFI